jgi:hypothetical protein
MYARNAGAAHPKYLHSYEKMSCSRPAGGSDAGPNLSIKVEPGLGLFPPVKVLDFRGNQ